MISIRITSTFSGHFGLSSNKEFMVSGITVFALAQMGQGEVRLADFIPIKLEELLITRYILEQFLQSVSADPDTFTRRMIRKVSEDLHQHTLLNPLLRFPIIQVNGRYFAPVPQLILERCIKEIYEDFRENLSREQKDAFCEDIGPVFEKYIKHLIENTNPGWQIWPEQLYDEGALKTCDLFVLDGRDLLLIECKGSPMRKQVKTWMSQTGYDNQLRKLAKGIETIARTAKHLKEGRLKIDGLDVNQIQRWAGIVVTLDEYLQNLPPSVEIVDSDTIRRLKIHTQPIRDYFFERCRKHIEKSQYVSWRDVVDTFNIDHLRVISADEFETLLAVAATGQRALFDATLGHVSFRAHPILLSRFEQLWAGLR